MTEEKKLTLEAYRDIAIKKYGDGSHAVVWCNMKMAQSGGDVEVQMGHENMIKLLARLDAKTRKTDDPPPATDDAPQMVEPGTYTKTVLEIKEQLDRLEEKLTRLEDVDIHELAARITACEEFLNL